MSCIKKSSNGIYQSEKVPVQIETFDPEEPPVVIVNHCEQKDFDKEVQNEATCKICDKKMKHKSQYR